MAVSSTGVGSRCQELRTGTGHGATGPLPDRCRGPFSRDNDNDDGGFAAGRDGSSISSGSW